MASRDAACSCGQLKLTAEGDPIRVSMCHCASDHVSITGRYSDFVRISEEGGRRATFHFCPDCGATVFYEFDAEPTVVAVPIGAFADPAFPPPTRSIYESRQHPWLAIEAPMEHHD
jgi:hypothetical protein